MKSASRRTCSSRRRISFCCRSRIRTSRCSARGSVPLSWFETASGLLTMRVYPSPIGSRAPQSRSLILRSRIAASRRMGSLSPPTSLTYPLCATPSPPISSSKRPYRERGPSCCGCSAASITGATARRSWPTPAASRASRLRSCPAMGARTRGCRRSRPSCPANSKRSTGLPVLAALKTPRASCPRCSAGPAAPLLRFRVPLSRLCPISAFTAGRGKRAAARLQSFSTAPSCWRTMSGPSTRLWRP